MRHEKHLKQMLEDKIITQKEYEVILKRMNHELEVNEGITWGRMMDNFLEWCEERYTIVTAKGYKSCIHKFFNYLNDIHNNNGGLDGDFYTYNFQEVNGFLDDMASQGLTKQTISKNRYALVVFGNFLNEKGIESPDITMIKTPIKDENKDCFAFNQNEIFEIAEGTDLRSKVCILLCYECALKRIELTKCKVDDFNFSKRQLIIYNTNRTKIDRVCVISDKLSNIVQRYINELYQDIEAWNRERISKNREPRVDEGYLFQSVKTTVPSYSILQYMLKGSSTRYYENKFDDVNEIKEKVSRFTFENIRNSRRVYLLAIGKDIRDVMNFCGDKNYMSVYRFQKLVPLLYPETIQVD